MTADPKSLPQRLRAIVELVHDELMLSEIADIEEAATALDAQAALLLAALCFVDKASGTALAIAMAGSSHPNPDEVLTDLAKEGMALSSSARAYLAKTEPT